MFIEQPPWFSGRCIRKHFPNGPNERAVYLTFDDGLSPKLLPGYWNCWKTQY